MEFWQSVAQTEVQQLVAIAKFAEELGYAGITVSDHLAKPREIRTRYPYSADGRPFWGPDEPFPDPWVLIAAMAQATKRLRFMTYVYVLPMRDPFTAAKAISTAAVLSNDRVVLGVGVGWMEEEFALTRQEFRNRGRRTDEMIEIVGKLLSGKMVEHHGEFYDFPAVQMAPAPSRRVEVRIGGHTPVAYRRAARHDGWLGLSYPVQELAGIIRQIQEERRRAGTLDRPFDLMIAHYPSSPDAGEYEEYARLGVTSVNVPPWWYRREHAPTLDDKRRSMEQFAQRYIVPLGS